VLDGIYLGFWKEEFFLYNFTYFFPEILIRGWPLRTLQPLVLFSICLDFWKENIIVNSLCFIS